MQANEKLERKPSLDEQIAGAEEQKGPSTPPKSKPPDGGGDGEKRERFKGTPGKDDGR